MRLAALLVALALTACSSAAPSTTPAPIHVTLPDHGTLYLGAGPSIQDMNLWRLRGDGHSDAQQLTKLQRGRNISVITAGSGWVVMSAAPEGYDKIYRLVGDRLERLIDGRVFKPALSQDGRLAYTLLREGRSKSESVFLVMVRDLGTGVDHVVYQSRNPLGVLGWGPGGSLGIVETEPPNYQSKHVVIVHPDGTVQTAETPKPPDVDWCSACPMVTLGAITDSAGQSHHLPVGWMPQTWSPDGRWLLVSKGGELGLVSPGDTTHVRVLGTFPMSVWNVAWQ